MTSTFMRPAIALALALSLAACGGGKASFPITGTIVGLSYPGLVLNTNGMDLTVAPPAKPSTAANPTITPFVFPNALSYGDVYNVVVADKGQPAHQTCTVGSFLSPANVLLNGASDTAGRLAAINIGVSCSLNTKQIGGTIKDLTSAGLVLTNGSTGGMDGTFAPAPGDTTFTLPSQIPFGDTYGVAVLTQPATQLCTVAANGTGVMGDDAITDIAVTCVNK